MSLKTLTVCDLLSNGKTRAAGSHWRLAAPVFQPSNSLQVAVNGCTYAGFSAEASVPQGSALEPVKINIHFSTLLQINPAANAYDDDWTLSRNYPWELTQGTAKSVSRQPKDITAFWWQWFLLQRKPKSWWYYDPRWRQGNCTERWDLEALFPSRTT